MRKLLFVLVALLLTVGVAHATNIPQAVDPVNYPTVWTETVYNGSASAISTGRIVQWDFDTSNPTGTYQDDMCPYVKTADAADDIWTAGVSLIHQGIAAYEIGQIIIKGPAYVYNGSNTPVVNELCGTDASGVVGDWSGSGENTTLGVVIKIDSSAYPGHSVIYVNPTTFD